MKVLLSAYACEPNRGSEPEVGWQRALHMLAFADEVWVLTRSNNKAVIEAESISHSSGLHFLYYDLPLWMLKLKKQSWFRPIYFVLWQWGAYRVAARRHRDQCFDCVYHVTFASMRFGSFMGRLAIPFIIGPIAGGERAPLGLRRTMPLGGRASELLRDLGILIQRYNPLARPAYAKAKSIYVTTPESVRLIPRKWRFKTKVHLAVAANRHTAKNEPWRPPDTPRFVFAGRLIHWKGAHLAIRALAEVRSLLPAATLTLIGSGPDERWLRKVAKRAGVAEAVVFNGQIPHRQFVDALHGFTAMVFPSLHDSGGMAVLEALSEGLPVICLDRGGPRMIVNDSCGIVICTAHAAEAQVVSKIASSMISLASISQEETSHRSAAAIARADELSWTDLTEHIVAC